MKRLLLLSNSTNHRSGYLDHAIEAIREVLGSVRRLLFVPFALQDREGYTASVRERLAGEGIEVEGLVDGTTARPAVERALAVFVGGGNTFRLLERLQANDLLEPLRRRANAGMPYVGSSAGTNMACPTIRTTNDMPIVQPASLDALGMVPFQINPHYIDPTPESRHMGETRDTRLKVYLEENDLAVVALREGAWLRVEGPTLKLRGAPGGRLFRRGRRVEELSDGAVLDYLLRE